MFLRCRARCAKEIADEIRINVTPQERAQLARSRSVNRETQDLYLQGMHLLNTGDPKKAIVYLQKAVDSDTSYAPAHAALALAYGWMGEAGWLSYSQAFSRQESEASRAIELDDALPDGHANLRVL